MKNKKYFEFLLTALLLLIHSHSLLAQSNVITTETELKRLHGISALPSYIDGTEVHQVSSYDRTGGNNDGFEGTYSYLRKNRDGSLVLFAAEGKGVIERIWTPTPTDDTLDFYFDGSQTPSYSIRFRDLFSGTVFPFVQPVSGHKVGGFYSYVPMPFANGCKIVFRGKKILFHQIQYRKYSDDYAVQTFNPQLTEQSKTVLQNIVTLWQKGAITTSDIYNGGVQVINTSKTLMPGQSVTIANLNSAGRIVGIELDSASVFEGMHNLIDLKITWDNEKHPAVYAPVADLFGFAFGSKSMNGLLMGVDSANRAYCFIPMPFDRNAKVELIYRNAAQVKKPVAIKARVYYTTAKRDAEKEGKLYAHWKREEPALGKPYVFLQGSGKGHYVGTILQSQGKSYNEFTEFFEGDDSTVIDGVNNIHGTGSEDYFNGGWYAQPGGWVERLGTALHGCLDYSLPYSRTGGYRFYITDKLPFSQSIYHSIEHGPEKNNRKVDYISVAFYYTDKPVENTTIPTNTTSKVFIPDTLTFYTRLMNHLTYEGSMKLKDGNAALEQQQEGTLKVNVSELAAGTYKIYLTQIVTPVEGGEVAIQATANGASKWKKLQYKTAGNSAVYVSDVTITNPAEPIRILFKTNNSKIGFGQVMFVK